MADFLYDSGIVEIIYFNFPSYEKERFYEITRNPSYEQVCKNVDYAIKRGLNIEFSIQKAGTDYHENITKMNEKYSNRIGKKIEAWETVDRAGTLKNKYFLGINNKGKLNGCGKFLEWLCVDVDGNCFICYNDFYDKYQYGNLIEQSIAEVVKGERYNELLQDIFGGEDADSAFICRRCKEMKYMEVYCKLSKRIRRV
jgi:radical SAM protein with 4Fe4S-binding SPASM domain